MSPYSAMAMVSGGHVVRSPGYQLILSVGQAPGGNAVLVSSSYQLQSGLVGATQ